MAVLPIKLFNSPKIDHSRRHENPQQLKANLNEALLQAAALGHPTTVEILLQQGADFRAFTRDKETPLMLAAQKGHIAVMQILIAIQLKQEPLFAHPRRDQFYHYTNNPEVLETLRKSKLPPNTYSTPYARYLRVCDLIKKLVSEPENPEKQIIGPQIFFLMQHPLRSTQNQLQNDNSSLVVSLIGITLHHGKNDKRTKEMLKFLLEKASPLLQLNGTSQQTLSEGYVIPEYMSLECITPGNNHPPGTLIKTSTFLQQKNLHETARFVRELHGESLE